MNTPVVLIIFNRPSLTKQVFDEIKKARPKELFVISDAARKNRGEKEKKLVEQTRKIVSDISWKCEVHTKFAASNLGCRKSVSSGLDWVFSKADRAIILEDDCVPDQSFFTYCEELLERYKDNEQIMHITGSYLLGDYKATDKSYYFSRYTSVWGWATWKRAWEYYDVDMKGWIKEGNRILEQILPDKRSRRFISQHFNAVYSHKLDTWDYQWIYACWKKGGYTIFPHINMVRNLGFSPDATHTKRESRFSNMMVKPMRFPLRHPSSITQNREADKLLQKYMYPESLLIDFIKLKLKRLLHAGMKLFQSS